MFRQISNRWIFLILAFWVTASYAQEKMTFSEVTVRNHRCLVMEPTNLAPDAPVIVALHPLGANGNWMISYCRKLHLPPCRFVLPDSPLSLPGYSAKEHAWYQDNDDIEKSREYLIQVIDRFSNDSRRTTGSRPVIILGFSQGAVMSLEAGLKYHGVIAAIVSMSGYIPDPDIRLTHLEAPIKTPILLVHGTQDRVFSVDQVRHTLKVLKEKANKGPRPTFNTLVRTYQCPLACNSNSPEYFPFSLKNA